MYANWLEDQKEEYELLKQHGILIGSFTNPEAAKQMLSDDTYSSTDEEFEETWKKIKAYNEQDIDNNILIPTHKKRRVIK
jgi:hypothetical protein